MHFVGDIALPQSSNLRKVYIPEQLTEAGWFGNLEGIGIEQRLESECLKKRVVFNSLENLQSHSLLQNFRGFGLANNHILDILGNLDGNLAKIKERFFCTGFGNTIHEACQPCFLVEAGIPVMVVNFGWEGNSCIAARKNKAGVNPYRPNHFKKEVARRKAEYPHHKMVVYLHWNYELELYPQPMDRALARWAIDKGVDAVIGCHSHRVQPLEIYKGKPIVYGLGNWLFPQSIFWGGKLKFPKYCQHQLVFEINFEKNKYVCHDFKYYPSVNKIEHIDSLDAAKWPLTHFSSDFASLDDSSYRKWFRDHRVQKKGLPVFLANESLISHGIKIRYLKMRAALVRKGRRLYPKK
jgi:poly-gamma-glutamate synthesis protein (capsule biosynthesis protein)